MLLRNEAVAVVSLLHSIIHLADAGGIRSCDRLRLDPGGYREAEAVCASDHPAAIGDNSAHEAHLRSTTAALLQNHGPAIQTDLSEHTQAYSSQNQAMIAALGRLSQLSIAAQPAETSSSTFDPWASGSSRRLPTPWDPNAWQYQDALYATQPRHPGMLGAALPLPRQEAVYQGYKIQMPLHLNQIPIGVAAASRSGQAGTVFRGFSRSVSPPANSSKRAAHDFSHNKAITKRLAAAVHYQQILDIIAESVHQFDEVNVATALHRLAKLQPPNMSNHPPSVVYTAQFQQLIYAIKTLLDCFEAQAVSNTLWAFATLGYYPDRDTLDAIGEHAVTILSTFRPQATSNSLWAYAKLGYPPPRSLLTAAAHKMVLDFPKSVPQVSHCTALCGQMTHAFHNKTGWESAGMCSSVHVHPQLCQSTSPRAWGALMQTTFPFDVLGGGCLGWGRRGRDVHYTTD